MKEVLGNSDESDKSFYLYPSVFSGNMDISKAQKVLNFKPTSADEAFEKTIAWYEEAFAKYPTQRDEILSELFQTAIPQQNRDAVYLAIDRELTKVGRTEEKYAKIKKGQLGSLPSANPGDKDEL